MSKKLLVVLILLAAVVAGALYGWSEYERRPESAAELKVDESLSAMGLLVAYLADEPAADVRFGGKVLEVEGVVEGREEQDGLVNIFLSTGDPLQRIVCEFASTSAPLWQGGETVKVRGICAGYNLDVLLQRCAFTD